MATLFILTMKAVAVLSLITALIILVGFAAWRVVYYGCGCRRNPIQKTALLTAAVLWVLSAAIINLM